MMNRKSFSITQNRYTLNKKRRIHRLRLNKFVRVWIAQVSLTSPFVFRWFRRQHIVNFCIDLYIHSSRFITLPFVRRYARIFESWSKYGEIVFFNFIFKENSKTNRHRLQDFNWEIEKRKNKNRQTKKEHQ